MRPRPRRPQTTARAMIAPFPMWWPVVVVVDDDDDDAAVVLDGCAAAVIEETVEVTEMADVDGIAVVVIELGDGDVVGGAEVNDVVNKDDEKGADVLYTIELGVGATTEGVAIT